jgi:hypothetical protein
MKQTAVEWYGVKIGILISKFFNNEISKGELQFGRFELEQKAKEMEKEQSHKYAEFAVICDRKKLPVLEFDGFIKL